MLGVYYWLMLELGSWHYIREEKVKIVVVSYSVFIILFLTLLPPLSFLL